MNRNLVAVLAALAVVVSPNLAAAQGDASETERSEKSDLYAEGSHVNGLTAFGILGFGLWDVGLGAGVRYAFPISDGVIKGVDEVRDEFALEVGADLVYYTYGTGIDYSTLQVLPVAGAMWNFWLADGTIGLYPKLELGYEFYLDDDPIWSEGLYLDLAAGIIWNLDSGLTLRGEASRNLLRVGVALGF